MYSYPKPDVIQDATHGSLISKASSSDCTMALLVVM
jgi:hypothetical protein